MQRPLNPSIADIPMPRGIKALPIGPNSYPVPWFVSWIDGAPEFRVADGNKLMLAIQNGQCWVCGERLNNRSTFVLGPMCTVNRVSSEPPSHPECAEYAVRACPFLVRPGMVRRENDLPEGIEDAAGIAIKRNPGVVALWTTKTPGAMLIREGNGVLFNVHPPLSVAWYAEGRPATRAEVTASIESGLPALGKIAMEQGPAACTALRQMTEDAMKYLPRE